MDTQKEHPVKANQVLVDAMVDCLRIGNRVASEVIRLNENADHDKVLEALTAAQENFIEEIKKLMLEDLERQMYDYRWE